MGCIPVNDGGEDEPGTAEVSVAKLQNAGVRSEPAAMRRLVRSIRAPDVAKPDERTLLTVAPRADNFIEKLYVNETGRHVKNGETVFRIYSPDMVKVQVRLPHLGKREDRGALQWLEDAVDVVLLLKGQRPGQRNSHVPHVQSRQPLARHS